MQAHVTRCLQHALRPLQQDQSIFTVSSSLLTPQWSIHLVLPDNDQPRLVTDEVTCPAALAIGTIFSYDRQTSKQYFNHAWSAEFALDKRNSWHFHHEFAKPSTAQNHWLKQPISTHDVQSEIGAALKKSFDKSLHCHRTTSLNLTHAIEKMKWCLPRLTWNEHMCTDTNACYQQPECQDTSLIPAKICHQGCCTAAGHASTVLVHQEIQIEWDLPLGRSQICPWDWTESIALQPKTASTSPTRLRPTLLVPVL